MRGFSLIRPPIDLTVYGGLGEFPKNPGFVAGKTSLEPEL
jgi:hypothetical protein